MTGSPLFGYLSGLHMSIADLKDADTILIKLAEAVDKIPDPARKKNFLKNLGADEDTINLLIQGADHLRKLHAEAEKQVHISAEAVKAAQELTKAWGALNNVALQFWSDLSVLVNPELVKFINNLRDITQDMDTRLDDFGKDFGKEFIARLKQSGPQMRETFKQIFGALFDWLKTSVHKLSRQNPLSAEYDALSLTAPFRLTKRKAPTLDLTAERPESRAEAVTPAWNPDEMLVKMTAAVTEAAMANTMEAMRCIGARQSDVPQSDVPLLNPDWFEVLKLVARMTAQQLETFLKRINERAW